MRLKILHAGLRANRRADDLNSSPRRQSSLTLHEVKNLFLKGTKVLIIAYWTMYKHVMKNVIF